MLRIYKLYTKKNPYKPLSFELWEVDGQQISYAVRKETLRNFIPAISPISTYITL